MKEKKLFKIWIFGIFILLLLFSMYLINNKKDENQLDSSFKQTYNIVTNYNNFYTVNSCIYRYLTYLQSKDTNVLLKMLDDEFINENNITADNLLKHLNIYEGVVNFNSKKMYQEEISSTITKYYVYGYIEKDIMDSFPEKKDSYFIVKLDSKNGIFTIQPYNGDIFKGDVYEMD